MISCPFSPAPFIIAYTFTGHSELITACNDLKVKKARPQKITVFSISPRPAKPVLRGQDDCILISVAKNLIGFCLIQLPLYQISYFLSVSGNCELGVNGNTYPESDTTLSGVGSSHSEQKPTHTQASRGRGGRLQWFSPVSPHELLQTARLTRTRFLCGSSTLKVCYEHLFSC